MLNKKKYILGAKKLECNVGELLPSDKNDVVTELPHLVSHFHFSHSSCCFPEAWARK